MGHNRGPEEPPDAHHSFSYYNQQLESEKNTICNFTYYVMNNLYWA